MSLSLRQQRILKEATLKGLASVEAFVEQFDVTPQTITSEQKKALANLATSNKDAST